MSTEQDQQYTELLKRCPQNMEFHTCIEFCGIDPRFLAVTQTYYAKKVRETVKKADKKDNI